MEMQRLWLRPYGARALVIETFFTPRLAPELEQGLFSMAEFTTVAREALPKAAT
jgi:hypothetical protein